MVTGVLAATAEVVMANAGDIVCPAATVTDAGTTAAALLLANVTTAPPPGAAWLSVTVFRVVDVPPITDAGDNDTTEAVGDPAGAARKAATMMPADGCPLPKLRDAV